MSKKATIIAVVNQKGGTGKTTTTENLGVGLALEGKKVLLVDTDPQASLTVSLGNPCPDDLSPTLSDLMGKIMMENPIAPGEGILHHPEGVDLVPSNIELSGMEVALVNAMSRETILQQYLDTVKQNYDYILLDCMPSLGMLTVNALAAADNVLIPVQAAYLPAKGLEQLLGTINKVKRQINPKLRIEGILLTMVDNRTNYSKDISNLIRESYGGKLKVYKTDIPRSVRAEEISAEGHSIFQHDPKGKVADAYRVLTKEVLNNAEKRRKHQLEGVCCPLKCRAAACMVWNWIPSPAELLRSSIPMQKSKWLALKRQTAETSTIWLWAMSLSATTKYPTSRMTSWDFPSTTISLPSLWIRFVPVVW